MKPQALFLSLFTAFLILTGSSCSTPETRISTSVRESFPPSKNLIKVNVTRQGYHHHMPWQQRSPSYRTGIGAIVHYKTGRAVLVTSSTFNNYRYVELENPESGEKSPASVESIDYEANLALLVPQEPAFLADSKPLELTTDAVQGDKVTVWQVKPKGDAISSQGPITEIETAQFPYGNSFLTYRVKNSLQYRSNYFTFPVVKEGKLAGLVIDYDAKAQTIEVIAAPVVEHFLKDSAEGAYEGFPKAGITTVSIIDPQLRRYLHMSEEKGGVYAEQVAKGSPAEDSGLMEGDVILEMEGRPVDSHSRYEHKLYGKTDITHLIRCNFYSGQTVPLRILRKGKIHSLDLRLRHRPAEEYLVPPYVKGCKSPRYYILGGLLLQELTMAYLRDYGPNWRMAAPMNLVYYATKQHSLDKEGRKRITFLSKVFQTSYTIGYEKLSNLVIKSINGQLITRLEDVSEALKTPVNGFHRIEFEQRPGVIYLDPEEIPKTNEQILRRYSVPALQNLY